MDLLSIVVIPFILVLVVIWYFDTKRYGRGVEVTQTLEEAFEDANRREDGSPSSIAHPRIR